MINKIKKILKSILEEGKNSNTDKIVILDSPMATAPEPELRLVGMFCEVVDEKVAEIVYAILCLNETNRMLPADEKKPIDFYISTYGGNADDMFALYDIMKQVEAETEIHTIGVGKVMSAGVPILAAGTKGKRKIGKNCRVMIHSVVAGQHGPLHNLVNEMQAVEQIQKMYINCLVNETKMTKKDVKNMLERNLNVYLSAEEAVKLGIADIIV
jgi:ATP-dependent Clp endopeptidase proteolytic subunit ClpP